MVRDAKFVDVPAIVTLLQDAFSRSHYAGKDLGGVDVGEAKRLLIAGIQRHGQKNGGSCFVQVSERNGTIHGIIFGTLARVQAIGTALMATDVMWYASEAVEPADPYKLMKNMVEWAKSCPSVIEIRCATTAIIRDDPEATGIILERLGLEKYGRIYRASVKDVQ